MQQTKNEQHRDEYAEARKVILEDIRGELIGPGEDKDLLLIENPVTRYAGAMLFPADYNKSDESTSELDALDRIETKEEVGEGDDAGTSGDVTTSLANSFFPSAMGISFYCKGSSPLLLAKVKCATYSRSSDIQNIYVSIPDLAEEVLNMPELSDNFTYSEGTLRLKHKIEQYGEIRNALKEKLPEYDFHQVHRLIRSQDEGAWIRKEHTEEIDLGSNAETLKVVNGLDIVVVKKPIPEKDLTLFTLALKNTNKKSAEGLGEDSVFFEVSLDITCKDQNTRFAEYEVDSYVLSDEEEINLAMLYRNKKTYAVGHGCAADWSVDESGNAIELKTEVVPTYEVPQASFDVDGLSDNRTLQMVYLGLSGNESEIISSLREFANLYGDWVDSLENRINDVPIAFSDQAKKNTLLCRETYTRITDGIGILENNENAMYAFRLANKAMLMQALHSDLQRNRRDPNGEAIVWPVLDNNSTDKKWRPFQLAFLLMSITGTVDQESTDRDLVDLIWFATGGGKTEAYLGLSAFTILYKRITEPTEYTGTMIMMRYTLRLLTAQQFQRACTLICALEKLRRESSDVLGEEEISIGLWVGGASTPNTVEDAKRAYERFRNEPSASCPSPVLSCPWCGTRMISNEENRSKNYALKIKSRPKRVQLHCNEETCPFNFRSWLPIKIVDDDIYEEPPTLLFGTVDKFAQMPRKKGVSNIFGLGDKGGGPVLIIQDELHLISGALGTMVALYETAVDYLCSHSGKKPKIIASTATVRRAGEQCLNLFGRQSRQFPQPGLEIEDSFFSKEDNTKPGRLYVGVMPAGKTQTTASVRLTAKLLQSVYELPFSDEIKDQFWTLVGYFNSIRELGGFKSLIHDDIQAYANDLRLRYGKDMRPIFMDEELTSRKKAEEIPQILEQLSIPYRSEDQGSKKNRRERPIDVLAASNMISVGVDIDRFGLMIVRGQPKMTSEYIQVSSRIGRRHPGLVFTLYNPARTRDRAHYERFITYHSSFYRHVEPSSITPFSLPARTRALNTVLVTMIRHTLVEAGIREEKGVTKFNGNLLGVKDVTDFVVNRANLIDPEEIDEIKSDIQRAWDEWEAFVVTDPVESKDQPELVYSVEKMGKSLLASSSKSKRPLGWIAPNSMRNVDAECNINIKDE